MKLATNLNEALKLAQGLKEQVYQRREQHVHHYDDGSMGIVVNGEWVTYQPNPTGLMFHQSDSFVRLEMGPYGSGKTTAMLMEIIKRTCLMPKWEAGNRRRAKVAIVRNTTGELESTTLQSWLSWFGDFEIISKNKKPMLRYEYRFNDQYGIVELELLFIPLDREDQVRKLKSLELTMVYLNELSEIPKSALDHFTGRVGRYPSRSQCPEPYWSGVIADTNPPDDDHWIHRDFEEKPVDGYRLFKQPAGLIKTDEGYVPNPEADNIQHLPADYYVKMAIGKTDEFVKVFCMGQYGTVSDGQLVYNEYNDDMHAVEHVAYNPDLPIHLGWDGGLTPACVVVQLTPRGQLVVLKEYTTLRMGVRSFAENVVRPGLQRDFPGYRLGLSIADPAGAFSDQLYEELSMIGELNDVGFETVSARTNNIEPRLAAVRFFLTRMVDGKPCFIIDKKEAPTLRKGFLRDYFYKRLKVVGETRYHKEPNKNYVSHPHDGLQYICLELIGDYKEKDDEVIDMYNPVMTFS